MRRRRPPPPHDGCAFAARCPNAMQICRGLARRSTSLAASGGSIFYMGQPEIATDEIGRVMVPPAVPVA